MNESPKHSDHRMRLARETAIRSKTLLDVEFATTFAKWVPIPKSQESYRVTPPKLKDNPSLKTQEERVSTVREALSVAIKHLHESEKGKVEGVAGAKEYSLAIISEVFKLKPEEIVNDEGALADIVEYLSEMIRTKNKQDFSDPDMELMNSMRETWELPRMLSPFMYDRVDWVGRNPSEGN